MTFQREILPNEQKGIEQELNSACFIYFSVWYSLHQPRLTFENKNIFCFSYCTLFRHFTQYIFTCWQLWNNFCSRNNLSLTFSLVLTLLTKEVICLFWYVNIFIFNNQQFYFPYDRFLVKYLFMFWWSHFCIWNCFP